MKKANTKNYSEKFLSLFYFFLNTLKKIIHKQRKLIIFKDVHVTSDNVQLWNLPDMDSKVKVDATVRIFLEKDENTDAARIKSVYNWTTQRLHVLFSCKIYNTGKCFFE